MHRTRLDLITDAAQPAVSVVALKDQVGAVDALFDTILESFEVSAREMIENSTGQILTDKEFEITLDDFPMGYRFPIGPVTEILEIKYLLGGEWATLPDRFYRLGRGGGRIAQEIILNHGESYPQKDNQKESVIIRFRAGKSNARGNQAIKLLVGTWFENRESVIAGKVPFVIQHAYEDLISSISINRFAQ